MGSGTDTAHARVSAVVRDINKTLVDADGRADIETGVCEALADSDAYVFAWIGGDSDATDDVVPRAAAPTDSDYLEDISISVHDDVDRLGPTATALRTGEPQAMQNIRNDGDYEPWREAALDQGFASSAAIPIAADDECYGVLNVYAGRPHAFDETELCLLTELGETVAVAIAGVEAQAELQAQKEQYERLTDRISTAYYAVDNDWRVTYWNDLMTERLGVPAEEVLGAVLWDAFPEILGTKNEQEYRTAMDTGEPRSFETHLAEPFDYWIAVEVYPDEDGLSVFSREISDRKRREAALEELHERTQALMETTTVSETAQVAVDTVREVFDAELVGFHTLSDDGDTLEAVATIDTVREQLDEQPVYERDAIETDPPSRVVWETFEAGESRYIADTQTVDGMAEVTPTRSGLLEPIADYGVLIVSSTTVDAFDETDRTLLELFSTSLLAALERTERERHLAEQRDGLEILNQMVRHDIRNDLQVILTYGDLLRDYVDDGEEYLDRLVESAEGAVALTRSARELATAMLDTDRDPEPVSLSALLTQQLDEIRTAHDEALVTTTGALPSVAVRADEMLGSVFRNLVHNGIVHNDSEVPAVSVDVTVTADRVSIAVADNGPGVPDEQKTDIFGKGEKGLESEGTGIGLYLVDTLVDQYGGDVWVLDRADADIETDLEGDDGSVFVVELDRV
jgi:PAS domain S-box-containing protein